MLPYLMIIDLAVLPRLRGDGVLGQQSLFIGGHGNRTLTAIFVHQKVIFSDGEFQVLQKTLLVKELAFAESHIHAVRAVRTALLGLSQQVKSGVEALKPLVGLGFF